MMKIIHCANFAESKMGSIFYSTDRKITNGLIRNNNFVYEISYRDLPKCTSWIKSKTNLSNKLNRYLQEIISNINPEILLLGHTELLSSTQLYNLKLHNPNLIIAMWFVDWVNNLEDFKNKIKIIDHFFITSDKSEVQPFIDSSCLHKINYMPNMCDDSLDVGQAFENEKCKYDIFFAGRFDASRKPIVEFLYNHFGQLKLGIFGSTKPLLGDEYMQSIASSKIGINFNRNNLMAKYSSDRVIQLISNGVLTFSPRIPQFESIFSNEEIIYFDDFDDLFVKINYYLANDAERRRVAKKGWIRAHSDYESKKVVKAMLDKIIS